jgi:uncharacterized damage-inducible protein DinB
VEPLLVQLGFHHFALHTNLQGLTHEESLRQPKPGGNCLNWVLGHIVFSRQTWLTAVLGEAPLFDQETIARYRRGSAPLTDGTLALPFEELLAAYDRAQAPLIAGLAKLTAERLAERAPFSPGNDPNETVSSLVAKLTFHEGYHIGQTALLRRFAGHPGAIA